MPSRRLVLLSALALLAPWPAAAQDASVEMWRTTGCGCCVLWAEHLEAAGYTVTVKEAASGVLARVKKQAGIGEAHASCHTAKVGGYVVEGHVPAREIDRLLAERPDAVGLAVPGMPIGSPGMEAGDQTEPYEVLLVRKDGTAEVFARY